MFQDDQSCEAMPSTADVTALDQTLVVAGSYQGTAAFATRQDYA